MKENTFITADEKENIQNDYGCDFNSASNYPLLHNHDFFEVTYIFADTNHFINNESYVLEANTILITRPEDIHCFTGCQETLGQLNFKINRSDFRTICDYFDSDFYEAIMNASIHELYRTATPELKSKACSFFSKFSSIHNRKRQYIFCKFMATELLMDYYNQYYMSFSNNCNTFPDVVNVAMDIMKNPNNFSQNVTYLLSNLGYSYMHVYRLFTAAVKKSPNTFFTEQKLFYAANLLLFSNIKIIEISSMCGFMTQSRFDTAFKNFFGTTPKQYRLNKKQ